MRRRLVGLLIPAAVGLALIGWTVAGEIDRRSDAQDRRSLYERFERFPGATEVEAKRYEITSDSGGTGEFGLRVTYELPSDATSAEVMHFYRSHVPVDWFVADDHICRVLRERHPPPPTAIGEPSNPSTSIPSEYVLMLTESHLTVFAPESSPLDDARVDGITFALRRVGEAKYLIADEPDFACGPREPDRFATEFDAA